MTIEHYACPDCGALARTVERQRVALEEFDRVLVRYRESEARIKALEAMLRECVGGYDLGYSFKRVAERARALLEKP